MLSPDSQLQQRIQQQWPTAQAAGHFFALPGLSGNSVQVKTELGELLARRAPQQPIPFVDRQREFRILRKMRAAQLGPAPLDWHSPWLLQSWLPGDVLSSAQFNQQREAVLTLIYRFHQQPLTGYRLQLTPLLQRYWQLCQQRHWRWQHALQRLTSQGEPRPLRLAPIHMDVHAGNVIATPDGLRLIDWEYAADGDVALELAALCAVDGEHQTDWIAGYSQRSQLNEAILKRHMHRWQPWLQLLMASWYQLRAEQSRDPHLQQLAQASWQDL
ncbi:thiamine kinase [Pantoea rodasii]|uniref:Thiamine kinase n=1 Tax=Pantoea rodasii TaxID=1076549 RepID=A0A2M9W9Z7_9GAMM|nr:thiamine kinase [Pantoea rodasii]ORM64626.1 LPS biosynthesis choline kinase [Pantoea rodasii]PJZ04345.1 thiamine kinase [Pantoea rodasii]